MSKSPIVARINALLSLRGISKKQFFKDCKISSSAFSQWNTGKIEVPRGKNIERIANYLDVSVEYLLYGDTQEFQAKKSAPPMVKRSFLNCPKIFKSSFGFANQILTLLLLYYLLRSRSKKVKLLGSKSRNCNNQFFYRRHPLCPPFALI